MTIVNINLQYRTAEAGKWTVPLSWLAVGLRKLEPAPPPVVFEFQTTDDQLVMQGSAFRFLMEKELAAGGHKWRCHKSDVDPWPSRFHAHARDEPLKLDAIDGTIHDIVTRGKVGKLKQKQSLRLHPALRKVGDLKHLVRLLPQVAAAKGNKPRTATRGMVKKSKPKVSKRNR